MRHLPDRNGLFLAQINLFHSCRWGCLLCCPMGLKQRYLPSLFLPLSLWTWLVLCLVETCKWEPSEKLEGNTLPSLTIPSGLRGSSIPLCQPGIFLCPPLSSFPSIYLKSTFFKKLLFKLIIHLNFFPTYFVWDLQHGHLFLFTYFYLNSPFHTMYVSPVCLTRF